MKMSKSVWIDLHDAIRTQLELQVRLSFGRHHGFMKGHGLDSCRKIADIGTGDGLFLRCAADLHPKIGFVGLDDKPGMMADAEARRCSNVRWVCADALGLESRSLLAEADGILMRYFLLHMPDTEAVLGTMLDRARPGTRLWVLDLDAEHSRCEPESAAFDGFRRLVDEFCAAHKTEIRTGGNLPPILERLGWEVDEVSVEPFNNHEINPAVLSDYLYREAMLYHYILHGSTGERELAGLKRFLDEEMIPSRHFVQYGMVMIAAHKRADASRAGVSAARPADGSRYGGYFSTSNTT
jgi:ubiquinone/menaquinone biosynthesis C-methylase UbiE